MPLCLLWLVVGAFAIGTESYVIAGLLPALARDLHVTVSAAGQLVSIFALTYAIGAPVAAGLLGGWQRRTLLVASLAIFATANVVAALSTTFFQLAVARILLALAAAAFLPASNAVAAAVVSPEKRGRAIAIIAGGGTIALTLGAPLGTWLASQNNWRATFWAVGAFAALSSVGLWLGLPRTLPSPDVPMRRRLRALQTPGMGATLAVSMLWAAGGFAFYTYIAPFLTGAAGMDASMMGYALSLIGIGAAAGTAIGGITTDRFGWRRVQFCCSLLLTAILAIESMVAHQLAAAVAGASLWAVAGWAFGPPQQLRLVQLAPELAPVTLSLHASAVYAGIALGSLLGAFTIDRIGVDAIGWTGAACQLTAFCVLAALDRKPARQQEGTFELS